MFNFIPTELWILLAGIVGGIVTFFVGRVGASRKANTQRDKKELERAKDAQEKMDQVNRPSDESTAEKRLEDRLRKKR